MIDRNDIRKLIDGHTPEFTERHFYQEAAEFALAVSKLEMCEPTERWEARKRKSELLVEIVDMTIMLEIAKERYGISDVEFRLEVRNKMAQNLKRVKNGKSKE